VVEVGGKVENPLGPGLKKKEVEERGKIGAVSEFEGEYGLKGK